MDASENQAQAPDEIKLIIDWLRNKSGMKVKTGTLAGKRVDYFRGRSAIKALLSPAYAKLSGVPKVNSLDSASELLASLIPYTFYLRVIRGPSTTPSGPGAGVAIRSLAVNPEQTFEPDEYYAWYYDANPMKMLIAACGMVLVVLAAVMFPLWPVKLRVGVWYLSTGVLGLLGLLIGTAIFRLIFWVITIVVAKPGIWIFPELFADVGFFESFVPVWEWDIPVKKGAKRAASKKERLEKRIAKSGTATPTLTSDEAAGPRIVEIEAGSE